MLCHFVYKSFYEPMYSCSAICLFIHNFSFFWEYIVIYSHQSTSLDIEAKLVTNSVYSDLSAFQFFLVAKPISNLCLILQNATLLAIA